MDEIKFNCEIAGLSSYTLTPIDTTTELFDSSNNGLLEYCSVKIIISANYELTSVHEDTSIMMVKLLRSEFTQISSENLFVVLVRMAELAPILDTYCFGCLNQLPFKTGFITTCDNNECRYAAEESDIGLGILEFYKRDPVTLQILIIISVNSLYGADRDKRFHPYPASVTGGTRKSLMEDVKKNFTALESSLPKTWLNYPLVELLAALEPCLTEEDVKKKLSYDLYKFIKFVINTNRTELTAVNIHTDFVLLEIKHPYEIEQRCKATRNNLVYHGSGIANYHSILRNGLIVASGTKMQSTGAAHGKGIYSAPVLTTAAAYAPSNNNMTIISVIQVLADLEQYAIKNHGMYVIPDSKLVIMRYLVVSLNHSGLSHAALIDTHIKSHHDPNNLVALSGIGAKKLIKTNQNILAAISYCQIDDNIYKLDVTKLPECRLKSKLTKSNILKFEIKLVLDSEFPISAPLLYIQAPTVSALNKGSIIHSSGALLHKDLLKWTPATRLDKIIIEIIESLLDEDLNIKQSQTPAIPLLA